MKRLPILSVTFLLIVAFSSCKNKSGLFIPADAIAVFHVNPSSLSSKLSWEEIKASPWFQEMHKEAKDSFAQQILNNPDKAGLDMKGDFFLFFAKRGRGGYNVVEGGVKDASAFEAMNKEIGKEAKMSTEGDYKVMVMDNSTMVMWNDSKFAYVNDMPEVGMAGSFGNMRNNEEGRRNMSADSLKAVAKMILNKEGKSLHDDDRFSSLLKESGDMHMWFNSSAAMGGMGEIMSMMKVGNLLEGNASGAVLSFDDGKISIKSKAWVNKELQALWEKSESKNITADVLNRIPSQNVIAVMAANVNPQTIREVMKAAGFEGLANSMLREQNLSMADVFDALSGEFVLAATDLQSRDTTIVFPGMGDETPQSLKQRKTDVNVLFAAGVGKKPTFQKLLDLVMREKGTPPFAYTLSDKWFVASKDQGSVDKFVAGASTKQPWADKITGHPFGMYVDLQKILRSNISEDSAATAFMAEAANVWQDVIGTGGEFKNGVATGEFVINMVDKKTNSLKQLNAFINRAAEMRKATMKNYMDDDMQMPLDSMKTVPVLPAPPAVDTAQ